MLLQTSLAIASSPSSVLWLRSWTKPAGCKMQNENVSNCMVTMVKNAMICIWTTTSSEEMTWKRARHIDTSSIDPTKDLPLKSCKLQNKRTHLMPCPATFSFHAFAVSRNGHSLAQIHQGIGCTDHHAIPSLHCWFTHLTTRKVRLNNASLSNLM